MKVIFEDGAHHAIRGLAERLDEAGLHVLDVGDCFAPRSLVGEHGDGQLDVGVVEEERIVGLHDVAVHGELVDVLDVVRVSRQCDETLSQLLERLLLSRFHSHVENLHHLAGSVQDRFKFPVLVLRFGENHVVANSTLKDSSSQGFWDGGDELCCPDEQLPCVLFWVGEEAGVENTRQCLSLVFGAVWNPVVGSRDGGEVFDLAGGVLGVQVLDLRCDGVEREEGTIASVVLPLAEHRGDDGDVLDHASSLAFGSVVDPWHGEGDGGLGAPGDVDDDDDDDDDDADDDDDG